MRKTILLAASALSAIGVACAAQAEEPPIAVNIVSAVEVRVNARNLEDTLPEQLAQTGVKVELIPGARVCRAEAMST